MKYLDLYKKIGVRSSSSLTEPVILKKFDFLFPEDSIWLWGTDTEIPAVPSADKGMLANVDNPFQVVVTEYIQPTGKQSIANKPATVFSDVKKLAKFKTYRNFSDIRMVSKNQLVFLNFTNLNFIYKYNPYKGFTFDMAYNRFRTTYEYCRNRLVGKSKYRYVTIKVPELDSSSLISLERALDYKPYGIVSLFNDDAMFQVLDLWRMLSPKHRDQSALNTLTSDEMYKTVILFEHNMGVTMYNLGDLIGTVKSYEMESFAHYSAKTARATLFLYLLNVKNSTPVPIMDIKAPTVVAENTGLDGVERATPTGVKTAHYEADVRDMEDNVEKHIEKSMGENLVKEVGEKAESDEEVSTAVEEITREEFISKQYSPADMVELALSEGRITSSEASKAFELLDDQKNEGILDSFKITQEELKIKDEYVKLPDVPSVLDKTMLRDTLITLDNRYLESMYQKDIKSVIYGIQNSGVLISNYDVVRTEDVAGKWEEHHISFTPIGGRKTTKVIRLPQVDKDGVIHINGNRYKMIRQRADLPIRKINSKTVTLSSYVGKLMVEKIRYNKDNRSPYIYKRLMTALEDPTHPVSVVVNIGTEVAEAKIPVEYSYYGRTMSTIVVGAIEFNFSHRTRKSILKDADLLGWYETNGTLIGKDKTHLYIMDKNGDVFTSKHVTGKQTGTPILKPAGRMDELLKIDISAAPKEFATLRVLKVSVPVGLILAYYMGFDSMLSMLKVDHVKYEAGRRVAETVGPDDVVCRFSDGKVHLKNLTPENQMLLNGFDKLGSITKDISRSGLNSSDNTVFVMMDLTSRHIAEIDSNETIFVDPITMSVLEGMGEPTTLRGLMVRASEMLVDDNFEHTNNLEDMHIKSYERIAGLVYKTLANAVKVQKGSSGYGKAGVEINRFETWGEIANDSTLMIMEDLNPIANLKQRHDITYTGIGGRSIDTMVAHTREFHKSDIGVISEASKDSGKVGVTMYATADPRLSSYRGIVTKGKFDDISVTSKLSISAAMAVFALRDDPKRLNFVDVQNQHTKSMDSYVVLPTRTGYEAVIPMRMTEDFAVVSREMGEVLSVTKRAIKVKYKESGAATYPIKEWFTKEESGTCYRHDVITDLKKGDKFAPGHAITYDRLFFEPDMLNPGGVALRNAMIMRTAYVESYSTYEDSYEVTVDGLPMLNSSMVKVKSGRLTLDDEIMSIAEVGLEVASDTVILQSGKAVGGGKYDKDSKDLLQGVKGASVKSGIAGVVKQVRIYYNADLKDMTKSLRRAVEAADEELAATLGKPGMTGRVDSTFSDTGVPIAEGEIIFKIYLYTAIPSSIGDKAVIGHQLKVTFGELSDKKVLFDGDPVHIYFSTTSSEARIVDSPDPMGTMITLMKLHTKKAREIFATEK